MVTANVILSFLMPPLGLILGSIGLQKGGKHWRQYILCICLFIWAFAYSYIPLGSSDLARYKVHIESFGTRSFWDAFNNQGTTATRMGSDLTAVYIFFWIIGKIGDYHLAPALTTFVVYYAGLYITYDFCERIHAKGSHALTYIAFILLTLNFNAIVNNIRNIFAFSLICLAVYRDCCQRKKNAWTFMLYIIAVFFHPSCILFILLRVLIELPKSWKFVAAGVLLFAPSLVSVLYRYSSGLSSGNFLVSMLKGSIKKAYAYYFDESSAWGLVVQRSSSQRLARYLYIGIAVVFCLVIIYTLLRPRKRIDDREYQENNIEKLLFYTLYCGVITISCVNMLTPEYWRFVSALIVVGGCSYIYIESHESSNLIRWAFRIIFLAMPVCTVLWFRALLQGASVHELVSQPFLSSPIIVFVLDVLKILGIG